MVVMKKYEYKKIEKFLGTLDEEKLNELGEEGWELCAATAGVPLFQAGIEAPRLGKRHSPLQYGQDHPQ